MWRYSSLFVVSLFLVASTGCNFSFPDLSDDDTDPKEWESNPDNPDPTEPPVEPDPIPTNPNYDNQTSPTTGQTSFISAAGYAGEETEENEYENGSGGSSEDSAAAPGAGRGSPNRQIEQGDIYQVVDHSQQILNLNHYRGLQIIDFSSPKSPKVIGRAKLYGDPLEMYLVGDKVYALINDWHTYRTTEDRFFPEEFDGAVVAVVDISDPTNPIIEKRHRIQGEIRASRLTRGRGKQALFVVSDQYGYYNDDSEDKTFVESFNVSGQGVLEEQTELNLGGNVRDIQGVQNHLLVSRQPDHDWDSRQRSKSKVKIVDISNPDGTMVEGADVTVKGRVYNKHNMDLHDDVLRIVSGSTWSGTQKNHFYTFDATDINNPNEIQHETFGKDMDLEATLFMDDRAFFVTFRRTDPFHTFKIREDGTFDEKNEFIVSGWNDFFTAVHGGDRLIGIGRNGGKQAVSLYDATDLSNEEPMLDREEGKLEWASSEANRDDRAYSVLENATAVKNENGTVETGLVLLPYNGWDEDSDEYKSGVQIYTFSDKSVTSRGRMEHGTNVRRSFPANRSDNLTANLSEAELGLYDTSSPENPVEQGRVELAPNYDRLWIMDSHYVRRDSREAYYRWYYRHRDRDVNRYDTLEIVPKSENPDIAEAVASIKIPARSQVFRHNETFVVATPNRLEREGPDYDHHFETKLEVWDLSTAEMPTKMKTLTTDKLEMYGRRYGVYGGYYRAYSSPAGGGMRRYPGYIYPKLRAESLDSSLVFVEQETRSKVVGKVHVKTIQPEQQRRWHECRSRSQSENECEYYRGQISCRWTERNDGTRTNQDCNGTIQECTWTSDSGHREDCKEVDPSEIATMVEKREYDKEIHWNRFAFTPLDLRDPTSAELLDTTKMPDSERDVRYITGDDEIHVTYKEPYDKPEDTRPFVKFYFKTVDFSSPADPEVSEPVNIPGELLAREGDTLVTKDYLWGDVVIENSVNKLELEDGKAELKGLHRFRDHRVNKIALNGMDEVVVTHRMPWQARNEKADSQGIERSQLPEVDRENHLSVLDLTGSLDRLANRHYADYVTLRSAMDDKAMFSFHNGLITVDLSVPDDPQPQGFLPVRGWPQDIKSAESTTYLAAGRYGIYSFDTDSHNL
jgi:hypothetical protein